MWPCFSRMLESDTTTQDKISYLRTISLCQSMRLQNEDDVKVIESHIQTLIDSPLTRYDGLLLWNCALSKSNLYLPNWGKILAAGLQCNDSFAVKEQCSIVLRKMVLAFGRAPEYSGAFHRFLPELIPILLADSEINQGFVNSCECLTVCMIHFPQLLGPYMTEMETFLMSNLNTDSVRTIETLSDLFSTFPRCLECTIKPKILLAEIYLATFTRTVNTLHSLLNEILSFQNEQFERFDKSPKFEIPCEAESGIPLLYNKIRSLANLSQCLAKMMSSETGRVRAAIEDLLGVIQRMFVFDFKDEVHNPDGELAVLLFLTFPKICDAAFILLEALVLNFCVDEQTSGIIGIVMRVVNISRTSPHSSLFYSQVRSTTWKFLNIWIHQSGCRVTGEIVSAKLVKELLIEIAAHSTEINDQAIKLFQYSSCVQALKALANLHLSGGCFLEEKDVEDIFSTTIRTVRQVQLHYNPSKSFPCPYSNEECRMELYNLLLTCSMNETSSQMKYALKSVNLFKIALRDPSIKVKEVCHRSFAFCRYYLHPKKPPPDYMVHPKPTKIDPIKEEDNLLHDWGTGWQNGQLNGHASAAEDEPTYPLESSFTEEANEMDHDGQIEPDSPPHYTELGAVSTNKKTFSEHSSQSYGEDSDSDDDKDSSFEEEEEEHSPREKAYEEAAPRARPTIQILEPRTTAHEQHNEDSLELGAVGNKSIPELSDGYDDDEEEVPITENGEVEESEDEDYMDDDDEEINEAGKEVNEDGELIVHRRSPVSGQPPKKKKKVESRGFSLREESSRTEGREVAKSEECREAADDDLSHLEAISTVLQAAVESVEHQEAISDEHHGAIGDAEHLELVDDDLQESISNDAHQDVEPGNIHQGLSNDGQEQFNNDDHPDEAISNQDINGENEDSEDSSSNEVCHVSSGSVSLQKNTINSAFLLQARKQSL